MVTQISCKCHFCQYQADDPGIQEHAVQTNNYKKDQCSEQKKENQEANVKELDRYGSDEGTLF